MILQDEEIFRILIFMGGLFLGYFSHLLIKHKDFDFSNVRREIREGHESLQIANKKFQKLDKIFSELEHAKR